MIFQPGTSYLPEASEGHVADEFMKRRNIEFCCFNWSLFIFIVFKRVLLQLGFAVLKNEPGDRS